MNLPLLKLRTTFSHDKVIIKTEIGSITSWKEREFFKRQIMHGNTSIVLSLPSLHCLTPCEQRTHNWNCKNNPKLERPLGVSQRCALGMVLRELSNGSEHPALSGATGMAPPAAGLGRQQSPSASENVRLPPRARRRSSSWLRLWILVKGVAFGPPIFVTYSNKRANWKHALAWASAASTSSRSLVTELELKLIGKVDLSWASGLLKWNLLGREMGNFIPSCHWDVWPQLIWRSILWSWTQISMEVVL